MSTTDYSQIKVLLNNLTDSLNRVGEISNGLISVAQQCREIAFQLEELNKTLNKMQIETAPPVTPPPFKKTLHPDDSIPDVDVSGMTKSPIAEKTVKQEINELIYFLNPDGNGFNRQAPLSPEESGRAKYVLTLQSPTKATFKPLSSALEQFRTSPNILTSLCDIMSGDLDSANEIFVWEGDEGIVVVEGGYWECKEKCKIELR